MTGVEGPVPNFDPTLERIIPEPIEIGSDETESLDVWGFEGTRFFARQDGVVVFEGNRYELAGQELPDLLPWAQ